MIKIAGKNETGTLKSTIESLSINESWNKATREILFIYYSIYAESSEETDMSSLFKNGQCKTIYFSNFNTSNVTCMLQMFSGCKSLTSLNVDNWDTSNVTDMSSMFYWCKSLTSLDLSNFDTSKVTNMSSMFFNCKKIISLDLSSFNTSNVTDMHNMFYKCSFLTSLDISGFDFSNVNNNFSMFDYCTSLTDLKFGKNLKQSIYLSDCPLTHESALSVIDGLAKVNEQQDIAFSDETYATLSKEEIQIIKNKNWNLTNDTAKTMRISGFSYENFHIMAPYLKPEDKCNLSLERKIYSNLTKEDKEILHNNGFATIEISPMKK